MKTTTTQKKIQKISSYLEEKYPFLYISVGGREVRKILKEIVFPKRVSKKATQKKFFHLNQINSIQ